MTSTSKPTPVEMKPGNCVVCGKATFKLCGPCASHGIKYMFFCSKEHQGLIWPLHKRFCGRFSNPCWIPAFTQTEYDEIIANGSVKYRDREGDLSTLVEWVSDAPEGEPPFTSREARAGYFVIAVGLLLEREGLDTNDRSDILRLRGEHYRMKTGIGCDPARFTSQEYWHQCIAKHPVDFFAWLVLTKLTIVSQPNLPQSFPWWTEFAHKLVIVIGIIVELVKNERRELVAYFGYSIGELERFSKEVVSETHPEMSKDRISELILVLAFNFTRYRLTA
ncbi:zinc finger MYND domain-containing protein [Sporobolomyces salmoneus]|uniref:zinc finger MYND domain-containing protein n=1 Tax=Sporobolomyces salmoneus TaxID=183962 RepID=UPI003173A41B